MRCPDFLAPTGARHPLRTRSRVRGSDHPRRTAPTVGQVRNPVALIAALARLLLTQWLLLASACRSAASGRPGSTCWVVIAEQPAAPSARVFVQHEPFAYVRRLTARSGPVAKGGSCRARPVRPDFGPIIGVPALIASDMAPVLPSLRRAGDQGRELARHAAARPSRAARCREFAVSSAARSNSARASSRRPSFSSRSPRTLGSR